MLRLTSTARLPLGIGCRRCGRFGWLSFFQTAVSAAPSLVKPVHLLERGDRVQHVLAVARRCAGRRRSAAGAAASAAPGRPRPESPSDRRAVRSTARFSVRLVAAPWVASACRRRRGSAACPRQLGRIGNAKRPVVDRVVLRPAASAPLSTLLQVEPAGRAAGGSGPWMLDVGVLRRGVQRADVESAAAPRTACGVVARPANAWVCAELDPVAARWRAAATFQLHAAVSPSSSALGALARCATRLRAAVRCCSTAVWPPTGCPLAHVRCSVRLARSPCARRSATSCDSRRGAVVVGCCDGERRAGQ